MTVSGNEESGESRDLLKDALVQFSADIGAALPDICSYGLTHGETYVPFILDEDEECEEDDEECSQAWVRVVGVRAFAVSETGACNDVELRLDLEVGVRRCYHVPEDGEAPTTTEMLEASLQAVDDMQRLSCAILSTEAFDEVSLGSWSPGGPNGDEFTGVWTLTAVV